MVVVVVVVVVVILVIMWYSTRRGRKNNIKLNFKIGKKSDRDEEEECMEHE